MNMKREQTRRYPSADEEGKRSGSAEGRRNHKGKVNGERQNWKRHGTFI